MRIGYLLPLLFLIFLSVSCNEKPVYAQKFNINGTWSYDDKLSFAIDIQELDLTYDLVLSLLYGRDFDYQNLYVKIITEYPGGKSTEDILSLNLMDGTGIFLGDCNSTKCEIDILLQEQFKFKEKGKYIITIIQNGREENLESIYSAELKLYNHSIKN